ncbi:MAG: carboxypeptidase M32 [Anaerolineae bacterium]
MSDKLNQLYERLGEISDLSKAAAIFSWDMQTYMPSGAAEGRSRQMATLSRLTHEKFTSDEMGRLLEDLAAETQGLPYEDDTVSMIRVLRRDYDQDRKLPGAFVSELAQARGLAQPVWMQARAASNWSLFEPHLQKILALKVREAEYLGYKDRIYDALLDGFEPGMKTAEVEAIFADVRKELVPLVKAIARHADRVSDAVLRQPFDENKQWDLTVAALRSIGFDFERGRQDKSAHPFTTEFSNHDVRVTTRVYPQFFSPAFFGSLHEGGHALYEQGSPDKFERTLMAGGASLGVHESQSRMWENLVGRSRPFWQFFFAQARDLFPDALGAVSLETFYRAVNRVEPSFIRVEADEVTYNLHIMLRFQLENALVEGKLKVQDVPEAWNAAMQDFLGVTPPDVAQGALQDIHWSGGMIGYFPTYSLGNFFAAQLFDQALKEMPDLYTRFEHGDFQPLLSWLREKVHQHGRKFTLDELAVRITGDKLQTRSYIAYLKKKYTQIYDL